PVVTYILHHHEKWDGTGYPEGLKQEDIPLESRILSIAADYDSYMTDRIRQKVPLTAMQALEKMRSERGTRYDPELFDLFEKMIKSNIDEYKISACMGD
ncbi:MAG: HD domain-containing phosphohydrolase, partial [Armatimonadota bacterium]